MQRVKFSNKRATPFSDSANRDWAKALVYADDGYLYAAGYMGGATTDFALAKYDTAGALVTSFGSGGKVTTDFSGRNDQANALTVDSDGNLIVVGQVGNGTNFDFGVAKYNSNGQLVTSFGSDGKVVSDFSSAQEYANAVALDSDGKIVVAGTAGSNTLFGLARYIP